MTNRQNRTTSAKVSMTCSGYCSAR